jgi:hypothetical protein
MNEAPQKHIIRCKWHRGDEGHLARHIPALWRVVCALFVDVESMYIHHIMESCVHCVWRALTNAPYLLRIKCWRHVYSIGLACCRSLHLALHSLIHICMYVCMYVHIYIHSTCGGVHIKFVTNKLSLFRIHARHTYQTNYGYVVSKNKIKQMERRGGTSLRGRGDERRS